MTNIRILIVDDHPVVRAGLRAVIESQDDFLVVGEATTGEEAVRRVERDKPDLVLMDLQMPGMGGAVATRQICKFDPAPFVVVLTTYDSDADILSALDAGAVGYLLKDAPPDVLFESIRSAARGDTVLSPAVASRLVDRVRRPSTNTLSGREMEVLDLVAEGLANKAVARRLHVSEATVKTHLVHIFTKLDVSTRTAAVAAAVDRGLIRLDGS
ncbi:MAG: response regulator transcription factor [Acidimicrobiia bacterium]|nr:response regulator transcription factor [Acidimicrobiia bacterium]